MAFFKPTGAAAAKTIAVMPFANLSGDPAQTYFSDGLAEELRNALSRIAQLQVVARTSSEAVRDEDVKIAAHKLGVANILTGSVRRSSSAIRINAQLVDGNTGLERWSQSFDRALGDSLAIQTNIAENVASAMSIQLGEAAKAALTLGGTESIAAHDLLLKAQQVARDDTKDAIERALALIDSAIDLDPNYAQAYARKALMLNGYTGFYAMNPAALTSGLAQAEAAARSAVALASTLAEAHAALSQVLTNQLRFRSALAELDRAVALGPNDAGTQMIFAISLSQIGRQEQAWRAARRAEALDPLNPRSIRSEANVLFASHSYAASAAAARRSLALAPSATRGRSLLANALFMQGLTREAESEYRKLPAADIHGQMGLAVVAARTGDQKGSDNIIRKIKHDFGDNGSYQYAQIYAQRGEPELAIASLRTAVEVRDPGLAGILIDPFVDPIRDQSDLRLIIRALDFPS